MGDTRAPEPSPRPERRAELPEQPDELDGRDETTEGARVAPRVEVKGEATCPLCLDPLTALPQLEVCSTCRTIHHRACVDEFGRCGTPACRGLLRAGGGSAGDENQRALAAVSHVLGTFGGGFLMPLLLWYLTKEKQPYAAHHAWRAFVFGLASIPLAVVTLGLWMPVMVFLAIRAALRGWHGEWTPYGRLERLVGLAPEAEPARAAAATKLAKG